MCADDTCGASAILSIYAHEHVTACCPERQQCTCLLCWLTNECMLCWLTNECIVQRCWLNHTLGQRVLTSLWFVGFNHGIDCTPAKDCTSGRHLTTFFGQPDKVLLPGETGRSAHSIFLACALLQTLLLLVGCLLQVWHIQYNDRGILNCLPLIIQQHLL